MSKVRASASSFGELRGDFLLNRYIARLQAENIKNRVLQILVNRMECMSDNMVLKTIRELSESGALEMAAVIDIPTPGENRISTIPTQQAFGLPGKSLLSSLGHRVTGNPVKKMGELLEALEHIERHFREREMKPGTEGG
jgi:hypothetical protein